MGVQLAKNVFFFSCPEASECGFWLSAMFLFSPLDALEFRQSRYPRRDRKLDLCTYLEPGVITKV